MWRWRWLTCLHLELTHITSTQSLVVCTTQVVQTKGREARRWCEASRIVDLPTSSLDVPAPSPWAWGWLVSGPLALPCRSCVYVGRALSSMGSVMCTQTRDSDGRTKAVPPGTCQCFPLSGALSWGQGACVMQVAIIVTFTRFPLCQMVLPSTGSPVTPPPPHGSQGPPRVLRSVRRKPGPVRMHV